MCELCKNVVLNPNDDYHYFNIGSKQVADICGNCISIALSMEVQLSNGEYNYRLTTCLDSDNMFPKEIESYSMIRKKIKFCPFCGQELEKLQ